jgi:hypothetical protein
MSIENFGGFYTPVWDICGRDLNPEFDFYDAVEAKKEAGWKSQIIDGVWQDICDCCQD